MPDPIARLHPQSILQLSLAAALLLVLCSGSHARAFSPDVAGAGSPAGGQIPASAGARTVGATDGAAAVQRITAQERSLFNTAQLRAIWVDAFHAGIKSPREVEQLILDVRAARANAIFVQVRKHGDAYYNRSIEPRGDDLRDVPDDYDPLAYLIQKAHAAVPPIEVHAWLNAMPVARTTELPMPPLHVFATHGTGASSADNWISKSSGGGFVSDGLYFLDPGHPQAAQYTADMYVNIVRNYDVDGIHLDFIRYAGAQWGYNDVSVNRYNAQTGSTGVPASKDPRWMQWRRDQVTNLVRQVYLESIALKPRVKVSAALITWGRGPSGDDDWRNTSAYNDVLQDWQAWLQEGILDLAVPMNYDEERKPQQKVWFDQWIEFEKSHSFGRQMAIGLGVFMNDLDGTGAQLQRALAPGPTGAGAQGVSFFSYATPSADAPEDVKLGLELMHRYDQVQPGANLPIFADWARPPDMPWKTRPERGFAKGYVRLADGRPADGYGVRLVGPVARTLTTAGTGFYGALDLPGGSYHVEVSRAEQNFASAELTVSPGQVSALDFDLPPEN